ncbi:MAG TPA: phosphatase PAP2 family protein [Dehalococcoidia bacterium]|nr:phosphatase PAP2 family protein [Dehalococcoidia bacterium]
MAVNLAEPATEPASSEPRAGLRLARLALVELAVAAIGYLVYSLTCGAVGAHESVAFGNANRIVELERSIGILVERQLQAPVLAHGAVLQVFNAIYMWGHLPLVIAVALWLFAYHRSEYRVIRNAVLISGGLALIVFYVFPLAPPRLVPSLGLVDTAAMVSPIYDTVEPKVFFNPYAAMPSMHIGWDLLMGFALAWCSTHAFLRWTGALIPAGMLLAIVVTGNHYVVDGVAGALVGLACLLLAFGLERLRIGHGVTAASPKAA